MDDDAISEAINTASFAAANFVFDYAQLEKDYPTCQRLEALAMGVQARVVETATAVLRDRSKNG